MPFLRFRACLQGRDHAWSLCLASASRQPGARLGTSTARPTSRETEGAAKDAGPAAAAPASETDALLVSGVLIDMLTPGDRARFSLREQPPSVGQDAWRRLQRASVAGAAMPLGRASLLSSLLSLQVFGLLSKARRPVFMTGEGTWASGAACDGDDSDDDALLDPGDAEGRAFHVLFKRQQNQRTASGQWAGLGALSRLPSIKPGNAPRQMMTGAPQGVHATVGAPSGSPCMHAPPTAASPAGPAGSLGLRRPGGGDQGIKPMGLDRAPSRVLWKAGGAAPLGPACGSEVASDLALDREVAHITTGAARIRLPVDPDPRDLAPSRCPLVRTFLEKLSRDMGPSRASPVVEVLLPHGFAAGKPRRVLRLPTFAQVCERRKSTAAVVVSPVLRPPPDRPTAGLQPEGVPAPAGPRPLPSSEGVAANGGPLLQAAGNLKRAARPMSPSALLLATSSFIGPEGCESAASPRGPATSGCAGALEPTGTLRGATPGAAAAKGSRRDEGGAATPSTPIPYSRRSIRFQEAGKRVLAALKRRRTSQRASVLNRRSLIMGSITPTIRREVS